MEKAILALGADIKNKFLSAKGGHFTWGSDIGDLGDAGNYELFKKEVTRSIKKIKPDIVACDLHPGYFSTRFAKEYGARITGHESVGIQHHHAHIASVMHEYGLKGPVIGVSFDGTGYGTDGNMWGGEFLIAGKTDFQRAAHLKYWKMPGGDKVVFEPWRMVLSILGEEGAKYLKRVSAGEKKIVLQMLSKRLNSPLSSSAGRLFDAAAALLGICQYASYEAEGPIKLESICDKNEEGKYAFRISDVEGGQVIDTKGLFTGMLGDLEKRNPKSIIVAKFHNSMCEIIARTAEKISKKHGIDDIVLSGGVFQNRFLKDKVITKLERARYNVYINRDTPVTDLNIAIGQYYVARSKEAKK